MPGFQAETTVLTGAGGSNSCQTFNSAADKRLLHLIPGKRNIVNQACLTAGSGILAVRALSRQQNGYPHG
ncbi:hypothetical protein YH48_003113 [Salmonella enterica subsp. enterica]|nr:hypothetical protein [Salmonella enterica]EDV0458259.1 hypothetical protein [Salmonella enterica subsp. enterica]EDV4225545.1 hypothetical protein [Salmonella enterica subsp. enterica serovar Duisburg]ECJ6056715.1 hypothetical protein [Salmonella enterica]ECJ6173181.1 hypothetical protein [Salmonella enterica]